MDWEDSVFGKYVDEKIVFFNYPNTFFCLGKWFDHEENLKYLSKIGPINWFMVIGDNLPDTEDSYFALYYIKINNEEHKELGLEIFKNYFKGTYSRYYKGSKVQEAFTKKI